MKSDIEVAQAGQRFVESLRNRADLAHGAIPMWHGWAIREAWIAGYRDAAEEIARLRAALKTFRSLAGPADMHVDGKTVTVAEFVARALGEE